MTTSDLHLLASIPAAVVGLAVGSFGGLVADRVPRGDSIVQPPSHCDSCDVPLKPADNIPVVSYLILRGRCRACGAAIPPRDLIIEVVTAALFALLAWRVPTLWALPAYCVFAAGVVALSAIDIKLHRLPTPIVYWTGAVGGVLLLGASAATGEWNDVLQALIGAAACFVVFFAIYFAVPKGMGFGDVRLAALCGGFLGWIGLRIVPIGILASFMVAGGPALVLLILGKVNRKSQLPFGPFLAGGALIGVSFGHAILSALGVA
ncbi:MAG: prepilin peptidase [Acidimicrobiales bacterium]|jgi:leader peptidase (prepilin peptidase)/N-methyltransferase